MRNTFGTHVEHQKKLQKHHFIYNILILINNLLILYILFQINDKKNSREFNTHITVVVELSLGFFFFGPHVEQF